MEYFKGKNINVIEKGDSNETKKQASMYEYVSSTDSSDSPASSENRPPQTKMLSKHQHTATSVSSQTPAFNAKAQKRRRRSSLSSSSAEKDSGAPPAKRSHTSESSPSVYSSPASDFAHVDVDTRSSSECMSTVTEFDLGTPSSETNDDNDRDRTIVAAAESTSPASQKEPVFDDEYGVMTPREVDDRMCPLPALSWANASDVWSVMCRKDLQASFLRDAEMLDNHPGLQLRMRAILLDWLIEVCEVYKLHRETFYLAVDFLDRYLSKQVRVQKTHLQLIGITCLFIAAKVEEIYPPKINEFAYVTDGACQEEDILQHELILLHALDWRISPLTTIGWLGVYMQLNVTNRTPDTLVSKHTPRSSVESRRARRKSTKMATSPPCGAESNDAFIYPQFSGLEFAQTAQLLDLCSMDVANGAYPYSVIAAAAISHTFNRETAIRVSGYDWVMLDECAQWMEPFFIVIREESGHLFLLEQNEQISSKHGLAHIVPNLVTDDSHIIQTHTTNMDMFERAFLLREQYKDKNYQASPAINPKEGPLTPPSSSCKEN